MSMMTRLLGQTVAVVVLAVDTTRSSTLLVAPPPPPLGAFKLLKDYSGPAFFEDFEFFTGPDPTKGCVDFVNKSTAFESGLAGVDSKTNQVFMRVDHVGSVAEPRRAEQSSSGAPPRSLRRSVRVTSVDAYDPKNLTDSGSTGFGAILTVLDLAHMPTGCATWPAFWMDSGEGHWPQYGEIDIIEGVHESTQTQTTLHTSTGCQQTEVPTDDFTGTWTKHAGQPATNCYIHAYSPKGNLGCPIAGPANSMGSPFNANGGGVYAMLWTHHHPTAPPAAGPSSGHSGEKKMWFFDRENIPSDLKPHLVPKQPRNTEQARGAGDDAGAPNPSSWGKPYALFWSDEALCPAAHFEQQHIIFDITLCGGWGGNSFAAACPAFAPMNATDAESLAACETFVADNPAAFEEAYWAVNSLKVFSATGIGGSSHNPVDQTDTNAAVSANRRDATEAASNATHGFHITNRLLLQQDSQVQTGEYLLQLHVHRESPKYTNPNGPCSTSIVVLTPSSDLDIRPDSVPSIVVMTHCVPFLEQVGFETTVQDVLTLISQRLGFTASRLEQTGVGVIATTEALLAVPNQTVLSVFENRDSSGAARKTREELRRIRRQQQSTEASTYDPNTAEVLQALNTATLCPTHNLQAWNCSRCANTTYFNDHFQFAPHEIRLVKAGGTTGRALLALVAPDHERRWIVTAIRGTVDAIIDDWIDDLELWQEQFDHRDHSPFSGAKVHAGFLKSWRQLHGNGLLSTVENARKEWPAYRLVITGHSLGGSVAALMAAFIASSSPEEPYQPLLYTFGQPRVGDSKFAEVFHTVLPDSKRVVHNRDIIVHYPFKVSYWRGALYNYHHTPGEVWLFENSTARTIRCTEGDGEDPKCSDSVEIIEWSGADHTTYFAPLDAGPCYN